MKISSAQGTRNCTALVTFSTFICCSNKKQNNIDRKDKEEKNQNMCLLLQTENAPSKQIRAPLAMQLV